MLKRASLILKKFVKPSKMSDLIPATNELLSKSDLQPTEDGKRKLDEQKQPEVKKQKTEEPGPMQGRLDRKRKVALMMVYSGKGYYGVQTLKKQAELPTIEDELLTALLKLGVIDEDHFDCPQKMQFQRAARTDKGVSAAGQLFSLKMRLDTENLIEKINEIMPKQMKVVDIRRVTKAFNAKNNCCGRTYIYMTPTYVFAPIEKFITEEYRTEGHIIEKVNEVLQLFVGTHNFHNYTSGLKPTDPSAKRYIISFECGQPFVREGMQFVILKVRGQSFVMHHIRKMVGLTIAIVRGFCGLDVIKKTWNPEKIDVPKAPGTGLLLEKLHFDRYNRLFGGDGMHEPIDWTNYQEEIEKFKEEFILNEIVKAEKEEKVMFHWLSTLHHHQFDVVSDIHESWVMRRQLQNVVSKKVSESEKKEEAADGTSDDVNHSTEAEMTSPDITEERSVSEVQSVTMDTKEKDCTEDSCSSVMHNEETITPSVISEKNGSDFVTNGESGQSIEEQNSRDLTDVEKIADGQKT